jgi:glutathione S-transferase
VVEKALQLKRVPYRRVELVPVAHRLPMRLRFGTGSVPAMTFADGSRVSGSRAIVRALEERVAQPALLPAGRDLRARVERAEEWGDQVLQPLARRLIWAALRRAPAAIDTYTGGAKLALPRPLARAGGPLLARLAQRLVGAGDPSVRADLLSSRPSGPDRPLDRGRNDRRGERERCRPADRRQPAPAAHDRGSGAAGGRAAGMCSGAALVP